MKKSAYRALLFGAIIWAGTACSNEDSEGGGHSVLPKVIIENITDENNDPITTLKVTVTPQNAVECAYVCYPDGETQYSAEEILSQGTAIPTALVSTVTVDNLDYETAYIFAVAAISKTGHTTVEALTHTTGNNSTWANTYIASKAGSYKFETKKVNGAKIEGIASADWIWATKQSAGDTGQELISDIDYENGKIRFTATGKRGNAVISAFDASGKILWSWLIWCTEQPETMRYGNGKVFLDRYLGATSAAIGSTDSYGLYYQWGRKDPFYGGLDAEDMGYPFTQAAAQTVTNPKYGLKWEYIGEGADIARSIAEPMHFFHDEESKSNDWLAKQDNSLWGVVKTDYDPCPAGYRVPAQNDMSDLSTLSEEDWDLENSGVLYSYDGNTAWYPAQGDRDITGVLEIFPEGSVFLWLSDLHTINESLFSKRYIIDEWGPMLGPGARSFGHVLRCVAE